MILDHTHIGQSIRLKDPKHESNKGIWMRVKDLTNDEATIVLENTDTGKNRLYLEQWRECEGTF